MRKFWLVLSHEYLRHVKRKRFIFALLSVPLFMLLMGGVGVVTALLMSDNEPIGYVDLSGELGGAAYQPEQRGPFADAAVLPFPTEQAGLEALRQGEISSLFILAPDYLQSGAARLVSGPKVSETASSAFFSFVEKQLAASLPREVARRVLQGPVFTLRALHGNTAPQESANQVLSLILPMLTALLFMYAVMTSGSYLLQALLEEKENRTMEIVVTSLSPTALMAGKIIGNMLVGLTQLVFWFGLGGAGLAALVVALPFLAGFSVNYGAVLLSVGMWALAFILISALMAMAGVAATEAREAQQISGFFSLLFFSPFWFLGMLVNRPNGAIATVLSVFPLTAPFSLSMRLALTEVPAWQTALAYALMIGAVGLAFYAAGRAFRLGMLRYGKKLTWGQILGLERRRSAQPAKGG